MYSLIFAFWAGFFFMQSIAFSRDETPGWAASSVVFSIFCGITAIGTLMYTGVPQ